MAERQAIAESRRLSPVMGTHGVYFRSPFPKAEDCVALAKRVKAPTALRNALTAR